MSNPHARLLRLFLARHDLTQERAAELLSVAPRTMRRWVRGEGTPERIGFTLEGLKKELEG